tara:strand:- start:35237 stop:36163 length:927 start_codon:yes stop_codon:yes gene_type:complete
MNILIALGGNALLQRGEPLEAETQRINIKKVAEVVNKISEEHNVIITHGNGPQVGLLALQNLNYKETKPYPLDVLGAESSGMIGYMLIQELSNELGIYDQSVVNVITRTLVDKNDPAFNNPTKFIGPVYNKQESEEMKSKYGWEIKADGEYYRRVVPSPKPKKIIETNVIKELLEKKHIVVCGGGGGVPTIIENEKYKGVEAVIDKDLTSSLLAQELGVDAFIILTDVSCVYENYKQEDQKMIKHFPIFEFDENSYPDGSMLPKIKAAVDFSINNEGFSSIGKLEELEDIINKKSGTIFDTLFEKSYY